MCQISKGLQLPEEVKALSEKYIKDKIVVDTQNRLAFIVSQYSFFGFNEDGFYIKWLSEVREVEFNGLKNSLAIYKQNNYLKLVTDGSGII